MKNFLISSFLIAILLTHFSSLAGLKSHDQVIVETSDGLLMATIIDTPLRDKITVEFQDGSKKTVAIELVRPACSSSSSNSSSSSSSKKIQHLESTRLEELDLKLQDFENQLAKSKFATQEQAAELAQYQGLTRIPKILLELCHKDCPTDLQKTATYLRDFTFGYISNRIKNKLRSNPAVSAIDPHPEKTQEIHQLAKTCIICMDKVSPDDLENSAHLECGHSCHLTCFQDTLNFYLSHEKPNELLTCPESSCLSKISPEQLALIVKDAEQALAVQRILVRSVDCLMFCPACGEGIARSNDLLSFASNCPACHRDLCFSCGAPPHHSVSCKELATDQGVQRAFIVDIIKNGNADSYGFCPCCDLLIEKSDGCSAMKCGQNAPDKGQIQFKNQSMIWNKRYGCGASFNWSDRVNLEDEDPSPPSIDQRSILPPSTQLRTQIDPQPGVPQQQAQARGQRRRTQAQISEAQRQLRQAQNRRRQTQWRRRHPQRLRHQARMRIRQTQYNALTPDHPNFVPAFAQWGPMYLMTDPTGVVPAFTLSASVPETMNHTAATRRDETRWLRSSPSTPDICEQNGGTIPSQHQLEALRRALGSHTHAGYTPLPDMTQEDEWFWSSSVLEDDPGYAWSFYGLSGNLGINNRSNAGSVRCVASTDE